MLSRVADSIYWMSRYVERAENVARFIAVNLNMHLDLPGEPLQQWLPLVITTGDQAAFAEHWGIATKENVIGFLTFDRRNPNSVVSCVTAARENARSMREIISSEMWLQINKFFLMVRSAAGDPNWFPQTAKEVVERAEAALKEVEKKFKRLAPRPQPKTFATGQPASSRSVAAPKTMLDAIKGALNGS